jgi:hypothetical protein
MSNAPWTVEYDEQDEYFTILDNDGSTIIATVAASVIEDDGEPSEDDWKLARLIAEVPAMAEALADLIEALSFVERRYGSKINPPTLDNARAILARIKGDAS